MRTRSLLLAIIVCGSLVAAPDIAGARPTVQNSVLNYAGPDCPTDPGWNCTTDTTNVVQNTSGGQNVFECAGASCSVTQTATGAGTNTASCEQETSRGNRRTCEIEQDSADGDSAADIDQIANLSSRRSEVKQVSVQHVTLAQSASGDGNLTAAIAQQVAQGISAGRDAEMWHKQEATQVVGLQQLSNAGDVHATISQSQALTSNAAARKKIVQLQNANDNGPDLYVDAAQDSTSGDITLLIDQTEQLDQHASSRRAQQVQGADTGGVEANYDVDPSPHTTGTSSVVLHQAKPWTQEAITPGVADQAQIDKLRIRGLGLTPDEADLTQDADLNSGPGAHQRCDQALQMRVLNTGSYSQSCNLDGNTQDTGNPNVPPNQDVGSTNTMEEDGSIVAGRVVDARTGEPIGSATVRAYEVGSESYSATTSTGPDGSYVLTGLAPGSHEIEALRWDYHLARKTITLKEGEDRTVHFALRYDPSSGD